MKLSKLLVQYVLRAVVSSVRVKVFLAVFMKLTTVDMEHVVQARVIHSSQEVFGVDV